MSYKDEYVFQNDVDDAKVNEPIFVDKGHNVIYRQAMKSDGTMKLKKINVYTTSGIGHKIRDAESGDYYVDLVGSKNEDLYFKAGLATGECKSLNGSNTLFYVSPHHFMEHLHCDLSPEIIAAWTAKKTARENELANEKAKKGNVKVR